MPHAEVTLSPSTSSVGAARRFLACTLFEWHAGDVEWQATQLVSELATNAVLHAGTDFTLSVDLVEGVVRLQVRDGSRRAPRARRYGLAATTGRGLGLVASLSQDWGVEADGSGKTVWCVLPLHPEADAALDGAPDLTAFLGADDLAELGW